MVDKHKDQLPGGLADDSSPADFDKDQLEKGIRVELEHVNDKALAREITMDHLSEDPKYYTKLEKMEKKNQAANPQQLQNGQSVWNAEGTEMLVLEDSPDQPHKVVMPADQVGSPTPQGVVSVPDEDIASQYSIQDGVTNTGPELATTANQKHTIEDPYAVDVVERADSWMRMGDGETNLENWHKMDKKSQAEINWNDLRDIIGDISTAIEVQDFQRVVEGAEDLTDMILGNISMPDDTQVFGNKLSQLVEESFSEEPLPDDLPFSLPEGQAGFTEIMKEIEALRNQGFATVDIMLKIGENFDRDLAQRALDEAKYQGIL